MSKSENRKLRRRAARIVSRYHNDLLDRVSQAIVEREAEFGAPFGDADSVLERYHQALGATSAVHHHLKTSLSSDSPSKLTCVAEIRETEAGLEADVNAWLSAREGALVVSISHSCDADGRSCLVTYMEGPESC